MSRFMIGLVGLLIVIALAGGLGRSGTPSQSPAGSSYPQTVLDQAVAMTQQMSVPGPLSGHEYHVHVGDQQLRLSSNTEFVREVEAYQHQIDRMLARTP